MSKSCGSDERLPLITTSGQSTIMSQLRGPDNNAGSKPWYREDRAWIRLGMNFFRLTWKIILSNYVNFMLVFVPVAIVLGVIDFNPGAVFIANFLAIVPLAALLSFAMEELSGQLGCLVSGLTNAIFGNAVELIVSITALKQGEIRIVQSSMLGSILNILLVLGSCFVASGIKRAESGFDETVASSMSSLMAVATTSLIIPATLHASLERSDADSDEDVLVLSHGTAIIMLIVYCVYLFYQLKTKCRLSDTGMQPEIEDEDEKEPRTLGPVAATVCLVITTILIAVCAEYLVDGIDGIAETAHISKTFIGLVLLPILGNSAEYVTACVAAYKDNMDLAVSVPIGSAIQVVLFITPFLVVLGWIIGQPMTLHFQSFETVVLFLSVLVVNSIIQGGKSNSLQGCMCLGTYTTIALAFYVYPDDTSSVGSLVKPLFSE